MEVSLTRGNGSKSKSDSARKNLERMLRSRAKKLLQLQGQVDNLQQQRVALETSVTELLAENQMLKAQGVQSEFEASETNETLDAFCNGANVRNHAYNARMIALCVNLAKQIPFSAVPQCLSIVFAALGLSIKVPSHDSVQHWCKRVGLNEISKLRKHYDDWLWIVDHSNQIGQDKLLVVLGIRASDLPPLGQTLSLDQLTVLAIIPGTNWRRDDVRKAYREVAKQCGTPRFVVCDGAVELRESIDVLEKAGKKVVVLRDFKHVAANRFEKMIGKTDRFKEFLGQMGTTRCRIQQTELAHLNPPSLKTKARFMNIAPVIRWSALILFALDHPQSHTVEGITPERLETKLGWVRDFRKDINAWSQCIEVIGCCIQWINTQGLCCDSGSQLESHLREEIAQPLGELAKQMQQSLLEFVNEQSAQLEASQRAWASSDSIESVFALYKRREQQQSRSGFTGLVASIPTLLKVWTPSEIRTALIETSNKDVRQWTAENFGQTVTGRRTKAYQEMKKMKANSQDVLITVA